MAEEKKTPEKQGWFKKLINWFKNLPGRIAKAFKNMVAELRKVTWPSKKKLISSSVIVLLFMLIAGAIVALLDLGSAAAVNGLYRLGNGDQVDALAQQAEEEYAALLESLGYNADGTLIEEPVTDETVADETVTDETVTDETVTEEPAVEEPATDETVTDETVTDETAE